MWQGCIKANTPTRRLSGSICEEKSWFSNEKARSYLSGSAEAFECRIHDFNRKDNAQKINAYP
ncbi:MAG: hypothetical protein SPJ83_05350 [Helicobacter sp.]|uniref:Uncharacterized protein n=1 Tax=Helicobacter bilis TaxID=37372 RepID=A0A4U8U5J6_9HELI|nr:MULTISPECIES: hypothetical protein [Helicobacter]MCI7410900.1 hypothetical protein [Helicobacter bilis]MDD7297255.1 hypothetical protein [Helicobacter bilis]MDY4399508.1 hypothetical protein [Helicobacter bilis]MDY5822210.1 hypothetical protein [Helicobacter sp.]TLE07495.1 hypothetical protein LS78_009040 [Helicobacter bilis]